MVLYKAGCRLKQVQFKASYTVCVTLKGISADRKTLSPPLHCYPKCNIYNYSQYQL